MKYITCLCCVYMSFAMYTGGYTEKEVLEQAFKDFVRAKREVTTINQLIDAGNKNNYDKEKIEQWEENKKHYLLEFTRKDKALKKARSKVIIEDQLKRAGIKIKKFNNNDWDSAKNKILSLAKKLKPTAANVQLMDGKEAQKYIEKLDMTGCQFSLGGTAEVTIGSETMKSLASKFIEAQDEQKLKAFANSIMCFVKYMDFEGKAYEKFKRENESGDTCEFNADQANRNKVNIEQISFGITAVVWLSYQFKIEKKIPEEEFLDFALTYLADTGECLYFKTPVFETKANAFIQEKKNKQKNDPKCAKSKNSPL